MITNSEEILIIRNLVEDYYDLQKSRIAVENQIHAIGDVETHLGVFLKEGVFDNLYAIEKGIVKNMIPWLEDQDIYAEWLHGIRGIGPILSAGLLAWIGDVEKFATISKLWRYAGLAVGEDGKAERRKKGERLHYNPRLKTHMWKVGESFVKTGKGYQDLYVEFRSDYDEKWKTPEDCGSLGCKNRGKGKCMKGHRFAAAKRKTVKVFLAHLWQRWRGIKGLKIDSPFIIGRDGHSHEINIIYE